MKSHCHMGISIACHLRRAENVIDLLHFFLAQHDAPGGEILFKVKFVCGTWFQILCQNNSIIIFFAMNCNIFEYLRFVHTCVYKMICIYMLRLPGMGMTSVPWAVSQARESCPTVQPFLTATPVTASSNSRFVAMFSSENLGAPYNIQERIMIMMMFT